MGKEIKVRIIMRYNSTEGWAAIADSAVLAKGEIGLEYISGSALPKMKIGNGISTWATLPYFETALPNRYTWGNLRGTISQSEISQTENLELIKPGFKDVVNIVSLNQNFDKIDAYYNLQTDNIKNLGQRITNLSEKLSETPSQWSDLEAEILAARTINQTTYDSLSNALDALNQDLQTFKIELDNIIGQAMPSQLIMEEDGMLYLADSNGNLIGEGTLVKDNSLAQEVADIRKVRNTVTAGATIEAIDAELKGIRNRERTGDTKPLAKDVITEIDNELKLLDDEVKRLKDEAIPDGLIYSNNQLYLAVQNEPIGDPVEITGGGGSGGSSASFIVSLSNELDSRIISVAENTPVILKFNYTSIDNDGIDDGAGSGELLIDNLKIAGFTVPQGSYELDVTSYLQKGINNLKIKVTNSEGSYRSLTYTVTVLALSITSNFPTMGTYSQDSVAVQYTVSGEGTKTVYFVLTKQTSGSQSQILGSETITSSGQSRQFTMDRPSSSGPYILEIYAAAKTGETTVTSNTIAFGMIWYNESDTAPIVLMNTSQRTAIEGETIRIPYLVFHPTYTTTSATFNIIQHNAELEDGSIGNKIHSERTSTVDRVAKNWTIQSFPAGEVTFRISVGTVSSSITMQIEKSDFDKTIIQNGLLLEFNATGRQNSDDDHDHWEYNGYVAEFNNVGWSSIDGWYLRDKKGGEEGEKEEQTVLRLLPGSSMFIPFKPFEKDITLTGYTIEAEIATQNVSDYDSIIVESFNEGRGFLIKSQSAKMSSTGTSITAQFKEDEKVRLTFVVEQYTANKLVTIYINGVSCGIQQYKSTDIFTHPSGGARGLTIGAESCGIDIYFIRFYNTAFSSTQQLNNFIVDRPTLAERIAKDSANAIINENADELSKKITINSLKGSIPYIIMECPELPQFKGDKKKGMSFVFVDPSNPERSFTAQNVQFDVQGTSSAGYPVKNFKLKLGKLEEGGGIVYTQSQKAEKGFRFKGDDSLLTKVFCLKADYASSENANNVNLVDYYNQTCPYRNIAMQKESRVRWGVQGEPIVLFWRNTSNNEIYFQGKYNMNDDKDNENIFGFVDILDEEEYPNIECWELLNNNTALCLFQNGIMEQVQADGSIKYLWADSFERRFPEQEEEVTDNDVTNLTRLVQWIASTNVKEATNKALSEDQKVYYKTRDAAWDKNKTYYKDTSGTEAEIEEAGFINSYSAEVEITEETFRTKIGAENFLSLVDDWTCELNSETEKWILKRNSSTETIAEISNEEFEDWGFKITYPENADYIITEFAFKYLTFGKGFSNALYEYHTVDTAAYRLSKFNDEFENYFVKQPMTYYYVFTETFLLMDSRAKNMFLMTFDGQHWFPSPYDMDTALGINNEGQLVFDYNLEDTDTSSGAMIFDGNNKLYDGTNTHTGSLNTSTNIFTTDEGKEIQYKGSLIFNGQESVLWNNFRDCFYNEIVDMYRALRSQSGSENGNMEFSFETLSTKFNNHQDMWPEVIWNLDQEIKYLQPFYAGTNNLAMAQGDKRTQRNFWMFNTFKYRDSKYMTADSVNNYIHLRIYDKGTISVTPYSHIYARVEFGNAKDEQKRAFRNETVEFNTDGIAAVNDLETHIYSSDRISKIGDLSPFHVGYCDFSMAPKLQEIIVGSEEEGYLNGNLTTFTLGTSELLRLVNISNCYNLTDTIDASRCPTLKTFKAYGSAISGVIFSTGGRLEDFYLPNTITNLTLREQTHLKDNGINIKTTDEGKYNFVTMWIDSTPKVPFYEFMKLSPKLEYLRLTNIEWTTNETELRDFYNLALKPTYDEEGKLVKHMGSLDEEGKPIPGGGGIVTGKIYVDSIDSNFLAQLNEAFPNLTIYVKDDEGNYKPQYFIRYVTYDNQLLYSYLANGGEAAIDPTTDESVPEETRNSILNTIQSRPNLDSNNDGIEDTFYELNQELRWENLPSEIQQSYTLIPNYIIKYLVRFYQEEGENLNLLYSTKVIHETIPQDPVISGEITPTPSRETSAQYKYIYDGWTPDFRALTGPMDYKVKFIEKLNSYRVQFFSGEKELTDFDQWVNYGASPTMPPTNIVYKYFIDPTTGDYKYYEVYEHIDWDEYIGDTKVDFGGKEGLVIVPEEYTEEIIKVYAIFADIEPIEDTWETIITNCENGNYKQYPLGTQKEIRFIYNGKTYEGIVEVVDQKYDALSESEGTASLTFILKDIFYADSFRNNSNFSWITPEGKKIVHNLAGGWTTGGVNNFYQNISNITFLNDGEVLNSGIKKVNKKTDFGPDAGRQLEEENSYEGSTTYYPPKILAERIWTPSAMEMGIITSSDVSAVQQGGDGSKGAYAWFTDNASRIKLNKYQYFGNSVDNNTFYDYDTPAPYWTRTWYGTTYGFFGAGTNGERRDLMSFWKYGLIFGFCV